MWSIFRWRGGDRGGERRLDDDPGLGPADLAGPLGDEIDARRLAGGRAEVDQRIGPGAGDRRGVDDAGRLPVDGDPHQRLAAGGRRPVGQRQRGARGQLHEEREPRAPARREPAPARAAEVDLAHGDRRNRGGGQAQRRRAERDRGQRGGGALPPRHVGGAAEREPHPVVADVQQGGGDGDVVALAGCGDLDRPHRLLVDEHRDALLVREAAHRQRQRRIDDAGSAAVTVGVHGQVDERRHAGDQGRGLPFVLLAEQPGGLPAAVDVLDEVEAAGVDRQAAVAVGDGVDAVGDQIDRRPHAGEIGRGRRRGGRLGDSRRDQDRDDARVTAGRVPRAATARDQEGDEEAVRGRWMSAQALFASIAAVLHRQGLTLMAKAPRGCR